jgi:hypothetical protein
MDMPGNAIYEVGGAKRVGEASSSACMITPMVPRSKKRQVVEW